MSAPVPPQTPIVQKTLGALLLAALIALAWFARAGDLAEGVGARNLEATYHVLLTDLALASGEPTKHGYMPIVSLPGALNQGIPWGATILTKHGDLVYTSFPPGGFLAAHAWNSLTATPGSFKGLMGLNVVLGALSSALVFILVRTIMQGSTPVQANSPYRSLFGALAITTISVFSAEALLSHGLVYWAQCLYQPVLAAQLLVLATWLKQPEDAPSKGSQLGFAALCLIGPFIEWTAVVFNVGAGILFIVRPQLLWRGRRTGLQMWALTGLGLLFIVGQLAVFSGLQNTVSAMLARFGARSARHGNPLGLLWGYLQSYGLYWLAIGIAAMLSQARLRKAWSGMSQSARAHGDWAGRLLLLALIPLAENLLLVQHASEFSFDRLKFMFPAAILLALAFQNGSRWQQNLLTLLCLGASALGWWQYKHELSINTAWHDIDTANRQLAADLIHEPLAPCSVWGSNKAIRAYDNLLFSRGIYELKQVPALLPLVAQKQACGLVYLEVKPFKVDMNQIVSVTVLTPQGQILKQYRP